MKYTAIDFETTPVGFFDKKNKNKDWSGHPRLAQPELLSYKNESENNVIHCLKENPVDVKINESLIFHNAGFDLDIGEKDLRWKVSELKYSDFDCTATMARLSSNTRSAGLKSLAKTLLNETVTSYEVAKHNQDSFLSYAKQDSDFTYRLFPILESEIFEKDMYQLYNEVEKPFIVINLECQKNGIKIDTPKLKELILSSENLIKNTKLELPVGLNTQSPAQLKEYFYGELNLPLQRHKGKISTAASSLKLISYNEKVAAYLRLVDQASQLKQLGQISKFVDPNTEKIHPYINPLGADTGRATSSNPNLQNIDKKSQIRELFVSSMNYKLIVLDFSQIEPRVLAHYLPNTNFSDLFKSGKDFYNNLADKFLPTLELTASRRDIAKLVVLATFYGMGEKNLAANLKIEVIQARNILNSFNEAFPEIELLKQNIFLLARKNGFVTGLLNRRRYTENLSNPNKYERAKAERQAFNAVIQGSAATLFKYKMIQLRSFLPKEVRFLNHIHDEIILEAPIEISNSIYLKAKEILETPIEWFNVPLKVEGGIGDNWQQAKK